MNMRDKFLNSDLFNFEGTKSTWHENPVYKLKTGSSENKASPYLDENEIFLGLTNDPLIFLNDLRLNESDINPDLLIFASRHTSKTSRPAFLVHTTGNWSKNVDFGGNPYDLSQASALLHKACFISLIAQENSMSFGDFSLDIEVTHHGPTTLEKPLVFIELGSSKEEWIINEAGEFLTMAIFKAIFYHLDFNQDQKQKIGLGFGGPHYAPNFNRLIRNRDIAMSFICPKYYIQELNNELIKKMIDNTIEKVNYFIIDWKGTSSEDKKHLITVLENFDIPIKKTKEL